jgi:adenylosuccinate lyase
LLALVDAGLSREEAYGIVQRAATESWERGAHFREAAWSEVEPLGVISKEAFWELFRLEPFVRHLDAVFGRLEKLEVESGPAPSPAGPPEGEG